MTVHFIGAGPGAADLLTLRARALIERCEVCLYAGSLVSKDVLAFAPPAVRLIDTAPLGLEDIVGCIRDAHESGFDVARLHSGDPSLYSAVAEQTTALRRLGIPFRIVPGVPAFAAAAAVLGVELTVPGSAQSVTLTRLAGGASPMPEAESLEAFAARGTLAIHLAAKRLKEIATRLTPLLGEECPVAIVARATHPDQEIVWGTLGTIVERAAPLNLTRNAMIFVGRALGEQESGRSALYDPAYERLFKPAR